jgi:hypothetical protein
MQDDHEEVVALIMNAGSVNHIEISFMIENTYRQRDVRRVVGNRFFLEKFVKPHRARVAGAVIQVSVVSPGGGNLTRDLCPVAPRYC